MVVSILNYNVCHKNQFSPSEFSTMQWLWMVEMSRVLYEGYDVVELAEVVAFSNSKRDPAQFCKQSGRVLS
jgi:hypothetical protein